MVVNLAVKNRRVGCERSVLIINEHPPDHLIYHPDYLNIERTDDIVIIHITLASGRTSEQKRSFYARVAELMQENPGMRPQDVLICLVEKYARR